MDVVKTQAHVNKGANAPFIRAVLSQARERGVSSLYRGVLPACARPQALCMYVGYEWSKKLVGAADTVGVRSEPHHHRLCDDEEGVSGGMDHGVRGERVRDAVRDGQGEDANQREYGEVRVFGGVRSRNRARGGRARFIRGILADVSAK